MNSNTEYTITLLNGVFCVWIQEKTGTDWKWYVCESLLCGSSPQEQEQFISQSSLRTTAGAVVVIHHTVSFSLHTQCVLLTFHISYILPCMPVLVWSLNAVYKLWFYVISIAKKQLFPYLKSFIQMNTYRFPVYLTLKKKHTLSSYSTWTTED